MARLLIRSGLVVDSRRTLSHRPQNDFSKTQRVAATLLVLIISSAGLGIILNPPSAGSNWVGLPFVALGVLLFVWLVRPSLRIEPVQTLSLSGRLIRRLTLDGRLVRFFPAFGAGLVLIDLGYNVTLSATPSIQTEDTIVLLAAATFLGYGLVPTNYARERDFVLAFFTSLNVILVLPLLLARAFYADFERSVDVYSWVALAPETSAVLHLIGVSNSLHAVPGATAPGITFTPRQFSVPVTVVITTSCSGIYSFGIFASAFIAFVVTEYQVMMRRTWVLLGLGLATSYVANVLRMVVIVFIGYYTESPETDLQNMLIAHSFAGWLIFLGWIALFWSILLHFLPPAKSQVAPSGEPIQYRESRCGSCHRALSPAIPAVRCGCGTFHHRACVERGLSCPACGRKLQQIPGEQISPRP